MRKSKSKIKNHRILICVLYFVFCLCAVSAQSTNQNFPTAVTSNEISGRIAARDIGDARLTDYFYAFNATQGDVFINVQTANFNGDIDIFTAGNLKPLTKITVYADDTNRETGRVVYLRQPAKLILRVEGRSPNDDAATFTIKFAGSFAPLQAVAENAEPEMPEVKSENTSDIRVNSVGTIIEVKPKTQPLPKEPIARKEAKPIRKKTHTASGKKVESKETENKDVAEKTVLNKEDTENKTAEIKTETEPEKKSEPTVTANENTNSEIAAREDQPKTNVENSAAVKEVSTENPNEKTVEKSELKTEKDVTAAVKTKAAKPVRARSKVGKIEKPKEPNPLENVHLIILLKDGTRLERAMSEVFKVGVDKGVLTVVANDGSIKRFPILDVAKMTIE